jgi:hypothetical protein
MKQKYCKGDFEIYFMDAKIRKIFAFSFSHFTVLDGRKRDN